jgi:hypothetical protein
MTIDEFDNRLDEVIRAAKRARSAAIDAGACQTAHDYKRARDLEEKYLDLRDKLIEDMKPLLEKRS